MQDDGGGEHVAKAYPVRRIRIPGEPVPKGRPRFTKGGNTYTPRDTRMYEGLVAWSWRSQGLPRITSDIYLEAVFFCSRKYDLDNLVKALLDGLQQGGAFKNDSQVAMIHTSRLVEKTKPCVEFCLVPI